MEWEAPSSSSLLYRTAPPGYKNNTVSLIKLSRITMTTTYYILQKNKVVYNEAASLPTPLDHKEMELLGATQANSIFLEIPQNEGAYGVALTEDHVIPAGFATVSLRSMVGLVDEDLFKQWGQAAQLLHWFTSNRYCGSCGVATIAHTTDPARLCPDCSRCHYPVTAPCIIVLIHHGNKVLLARSPRFRRRIYSTLAGFVEPGESAEDTVHREIFEEVGLRVKNIRYHKSQPWPFPGQLMLGFFAEYDSGAIAIDNDEICDACWFSYDNLPEIPEAGTIAGQLIRHYINSL